jgi:cell division protein FtsB
LQKRFHDLRKSIGQSTNQQPTGKTRQPNLSTNNNSADGTTTRKEVQCPYRLLNILFSDDFAEEFGSLGNAPNRSDIDSGDVAYEVGFWKKVANAFPENKLDYNLFNFNDDYVFINENIQVGKVVIHDWKKLRSMWKGVNAEYKAAFTRYTLSGSHESNFYNFCQGKKESYYLRLHLNQRPGLNSMVEAGLPESCNLSSSTSKEERELAAASSATTSVTKTPKKRQTDSLAEVLTVTASNGLVLNERKIEYMDSEQGRKERDSDRKERDLQMRLTESKVRMEESLIRIDKTKVRIGDIRYAEFTKLRSDLKLLMQELAKAKTDNSCTEEEIEELNNNISTLKARKKHCSMCLDNLNN